MAIKATGSAAAAFALVIQIAVAVVLFVAIAVAASVLNLVTNYCETNRLTASWFIQGMHGLEFLLWSADVTCFVLLIVVEVRRFCVTIWKGLGD